MKKDYSDEEFPLSKSRQLVKEFEEMLLANQYLFFDQESYEYLIDYYESGFEFCKVETVVDLALEQYPYSSLFIIKKARLALDVQKYGDALDLLNKAQLLSPTDLEIFVLQAEAYTNIERYNEALDCLHSAVPYANDTEKADIYLSIADVYDSAENEKKAYAYIKSAIAIVPTHEGALSRIGHYIGSLDEHKENIELHKRIIDYDPYCDLAWYNLGSSYANLGSYENAIEAYEFVTAINDNYDLAYVGIGDAYLALENLEKAKENYLMALEIGDPYEELYSQIAQTCIGLMQYNEALSYLKKITHINTSNAYFYEQKGNCLIQLGDWKKAIVAFKQALLLEQDSVAYLIKIAFCFENLDDTANAMACYNTLILQHPNNVLSWVNVVLLHFDNQDYQIALDTIYSAKEHLGNHAALCYQQAACLYAAGQKAEAVVCFNLALSIDEELNPLFFDMLPLLKENSLFANLL